MFVHLIVVLILAALAWWVVGQLGLPEPVKRIVTVILVVVVVLWLVQVLLGGPAVVRL